MSKAKKAAAAVVTYREVFLWVGVILCQFGIHIPIPQVDSLAVPAVAHSMSVHGEDAPCRFFITSSGEISQVCNR